MLFRLKVGLKHLVLRYAMNSGLFIHKSYFTSINILALTLMVSSPPVNYFVQKKKSSKDAVKSSNRDGNGSEDTPKAELKKKLSTMKEEVYICYFWQYN